MFIKLVRSLSFTLFCKVYERMSKTTDGDSRLVSLGLKTAKDYFRLHDFSMATKSLDKTEKVFLF
jgi:hypothetical protein